MASSAMRRCAAAGAAISMGMIVGLAPGQQGAAELNKTELQHNVSFENARQMHVTSLGGVSQLSPDQDGSARGGECQLVSTYASQEFTGGTYFVQAGFVESEIAAASYTLSPGLFPIRIDLVEALLGTAGTNVPTTTEYTILVWDGTPDNGTLVASFSSDGSIIPHVQIPAGPPQAVNVNFLIDPGDPEQIFINNTSGQNTFTIGFRIDEHNNQSGNGCFPAPPETSNAFPMTDTDGADQTGNWINAINCGPLGCPPGWSTFQQFPALCTPSGDWMLRATWTSFTCSDQTGACCDGMGNCFDLTQAECDAITGSFQGAGTQCAGFTCPIPEGACCLSNGNCLLQTEASCGLIGGQWQGANSECNGSLCPIGAACLPDGSCIDGVTALEAEMMGGTFLGVGTLCDGTDCPQPRGACCITTTENCLQLTEEDCDLIPSTVWQGAGSICDSDGDGQPDGMCIAPNEPCTADTNGDGFLSPADFNSWILAFNTQAPACDQNGDAACTPADFNSWILNYNAGCP